MSSTAVILKVIQTQKLPAEFRNGSIPLNVMVSLLQEYSGCLVSIVLENVFAPGEAASDSNVAAANLHVPFFLPLPFAFDHQTSHWQVGLNPQNEPGELMHSGWHLQQHTQTSQMDNSTHGMHQYHFMGGLLRIGCYAVIKSRAAMI
ncbi:hypothetical protein Moror_11226 [Moniliophthora roreri MCA 2997]|uniref:Uncharacterized protein n=1 Tax=Moniliophthora roreri (strain MCA 2997) TaxID=1381753 RepID=V2W760_MONRO|nr:hypothetical protein Moror_11226 [Moniliophthora roreri MCA 2997]